MLGASSRTMRTVDAGNVLSAEPHVPVVGAGMFDRWLPAGPGGVNRDGEQGIRHPRNALQAAPPVVGSEEPRPVSRAGAREHRATHRHDFRFCETPRRRQRGERNARSRLLQINPRNFATCSSEGSGDENSRL